jgi:hypothetical protein
MRRSEVDIKVSVDLKATLPKEFIVKYKDLEEHELADMFFEELFPKWFDVQANDDLDICVNRNEETVDVSFTYDSYTTEHYSPGDWYTQDEYSYDWDEHNFPIPKELCIKMNQDFETY